VVIHGACALPTPRLPQSRFRSSTTRGQFKASAGSFSIGTYGGNLTKAMEHVTTIDVAKTTLRDRVWRLDVVGRRHPASALAHLYCHRRIRFHRLYLHKRLVASGADLGFGHGGRPFYPRHFRRSCQELSALVAVSGIYSVRDVWVLRLGETAAA
jgi:hypothetical protein